MRQFFLSFLLIVTAAVSLTFGGMVFMNHGAGMMMSDDGCAFGACAGSHDGERSGVDCVSHCLQSSTAQGTMPISTSISSILLIVVAALFGFSFKREVISMFFRNDNDIGKFLLHRQLSTVIIRD